MEGVGIGQGKDLREGQQRVDEAVRKPCPKTLRGAGYARLQDGLHPFAWDSLKNRLGHVHASSPFRCQFKGPNVAEQYKYIDLYCLENKILIISHKARATRREAMKRDACGTEGHEGGFYIARVW